MVVLLLILNLYQVQDCRECRLLESGVQLFEAQSYVAARDSFRLAISKSRQNENHLFEAYSLINQANCFYRMDQLDSSLYYNRLAANKFNDIGDVAQEFYARRNIAVIMNIKGQYREAIRILSEIAPELKELQNPRLSYSYQITLGRSWEELEEFELAQTAYLQAQKVAESGSLQREKNGVLISLGNLHLRKGVLDSASQKFKQALNGSKSLNDSVRMAMAYNNLGEVALRLGDFEEAQQRLHAAIEIKRKADPLSLSSSYYRLAEAYLSVDEFVFAKAYIDSALLSNDFEIRFGAHKVLKSFHTMKRDFESALEVMEVLDSMRNEQFNSERMAAQKLQAANALSMVNSQLDAQLAENRNQQMLNSFTILLIAIAIPIAIVFYFLYRKNKKLSVRNEVLLKEQNHRVKNNLQMISSLLSSQARKLDSEDAKAIIGSSQGRINSVALLHRMLYQGDDLAIVNIAAYANELIEEIKHASPTSFDIEIEVSPEETIPVEKAISLGLIINELLTNSLKHHPADSKLSVRLNLTHEQDNEWIFTYSDNGPGVHADKWHSTASFGNHLIRVQCEQLRGSYEINNTKGFLFTMTFELN